jgi:hypothetical protein
MNSPTPLSDREPATLAPPEQSDQQATPRGTQYTIQGVTYSSQRALAKAFNLDHVTLFGRLKSKYWTLEQAVGLAPAPQSPHTQGKEVIVAGERYSSMGAACRATGVDKGVFFARRRAGWPLEQALGLIPHISRALSLTVGGVTYPSLEAAGVAHGVAGQVIGARLKRGCTPAQAVGIEPYPRAPRTKWRVPKELRDGSTGVLIIAGERFVWKEPPAAATE